MKIGLECGNLLELVPRSPRHGIQRPSERLGGAEFDDVAHRSKSPTKGKFLLSPGLEWDAVVYGPEPDV